MLLRNSIQTEAVDLAPAARLSAYSLYAFSFFAGQARRRADLMLSTATLAAASFIV